MATSNVVETILKLRGSREFQAGAKQSAKSILGLGDATEESGKKAKLGWKGVAKWAGGTAAIYGASRYLKSAVSTTANMAKSTMALQRSTGLDVKQSSRWAAVTKARNIDTTKFQMSLTKLSRTLVAAREGSKTAGNALRKAGVSATTIQMGDVQQALFETADRYSQMVDPAEKATVAQQLFGRQALALAPLLGAGSKGMKEQLQLADTLGLTLNDKTVNGTKDLVAAQRMLTMAQDGLKVQIGQALLPVLTQLVGMLVKFFQILQPITRDSTVLKVVIVALTAAFIAFKIATIASTISALAFNSALLIIPLAIIAVVAAVVILYKKWSWFHNAVNNTWNFIKTHWKLLATLIGGPLVGAIIVLVTHFRDLKRVATDVFNWIKRAATDAWNVVKKVAGPLVKVAGAVGKVGGFAGKVIGARATGGPVQRTGPYLVGERGPEIVTMRGGSNVFPLSPVAPLGAAPGLEGVAGQTIVTKVYLNRRQIAEAVGQYTSDQKARR